MIKLILIDFDDTLVMTEEACYKLENDIAASMGFTAMPRPVHRANWGKPIAEAIAERFNGIDVDVFLQRLHQEIPVYVRRGELDQVPSANIHTLQQLRQAGYKTACLTSRTLAEVEHLLVAQHDLSEVLDGFYHADNVTLTKPDPHVFDQAMSDFGLTANQIIYVGDSVSDARCANGAGVRFIASLESGLRQSQDFAGLNVEAFLPNFAALSDYIENRR